LLVAISGCGLISSDVTDVNLNLPDKRFTIDTMSWNVDQQMAMAVLNTPCSSSTQCMAAAENACTMDCTGTCNSSMRCAINLDVGLHTNVNLLMEKPELQQLNDRPVIEVTVDAVQYVVDQNTLNVDTPEIGVYVAPMSVMDPTDPMAKKIGTIAPIPAGMTFTTAQDLKFTADGKQQLISSMNNFKTPFNVIVGSQLSITSGTPVPQGRVDAIIRIRAHAGI
jgi:hypothetical protein